MTAAAFGLMALVLVGPVPDRLSRATWPLHAPRAAMALWQAIALAAVLSAFSCGLAIAAGLHASRIDGTPLRYNSADPYLPDLVICRAELAEAVLAALAG